ncbi:MAG: NfeD family protein [Clostridia bacterium]|nr:NfeD family protein [Clostridia bacterium]
MNIEFSMSLFWIVLTVILVVAEVLTAQMITTWFAIGAFVALIVSVFSTPFWLQAVIFVFVSLVSLILTRPLVKKHIDAKKVPTNADRVIGMVGIVTEAIDNNNAVGQVKTDGAVWSARSVDGSIINVGNKVRIIRIEGVKLIVSEK